jgi:DNA-binding GntR family transcriptional regulator
LPARHGYPAGVKFEGQRTLRGRAHQILRDELLAGRLKPGQRVNEVQVAAAIGVSRGTLREAIRTLEQEGVFISIPHRGTFVRRFTPQEAEELQEVRQSLETTAAQRVARAWSPPVKAYLEQHLHELRAAYESALPFPDRLAADLAFHEAICESSGNLTLLELWRSLIGNITVLQLNVGEDRMTPLQAPGDHEALLASIASRDDARIRAVFARVFDDGRRVVASAVEEDVAAGNREIEPD